MSDSVEKDGAQAPVIVITATPDPSEFAKWDAILSVGDVESVFIAPTALDAIRGAIAEFEKFAVQSAVRQYDKDSRR